MLARQVNVQPQAVLPDQRMEQPLQQTAGVAQHHLIDLDNQIALFCQRNEAARLVDLPLLIHQTSQQLYLHHAAIAQTQDRLEVGQDTILFQGLLQGCLLFRFAHCQNR